MTGTRCPGRACPGPGRCRLSGDARASALLAKAATAGLKPQSDAELLPVLLELIGSNIPVSKWPTQLKKSQRTEHARETHQARAAQADRPPDRAAPARLTDPALPLPLPLPKRRRQRC